MNKPYLTLMFTLALLLLSVHNVHADRYESYFQCLENL